MGYTGRWLHLAELGVQVLLLAMTLAVTRGNRRSEPAGRQSASPEPVSHETDVLERPSVEIPSRRTAEQTRASR